MKLPGDVSARRLIHALHQFGYEEVRQKGSHIRLRFGGPPPHSVTVPNHDPLKKGTLHGILTAVSEARSISIDEIIEFL